MSPIITREEFETDDEYLQSDIVKAINRSCPQGNVNFKGDNCYIGKKLMVIKTSTNLPLRAITKF